MRSTKRRRAVADPRAWKDSGMNFDDSQRAVLGGLAPAARVLLATGGLARDARSIDVEPLHAEAGKGCGPRIAKRLDARHQSRLLGVGNKSFASATKTEKAWKSRPLLETLSPSYWTITWPPTRTRARPRCSAVGTGSVRGPSALSTSASGPNLPSRCPPYVPSITWPGSNWFHF